MPPAVKRFGKNRHRRDGVREELGGRTLNALVHNAGSSSTDQLLLQSVADLRRQIDVNLVGVFAVTRVFAPLLGADESLAGLKGRIVNISSGGTTGSLLSPSRDWRIVIT